MHGTNGTVKRTSQDKPKGKLTGAAGKHLVESAIVVSAMMGEHLGTCAPPRFPGLAAEDPNA